MIFISSFFWWRLLFIIIFIIVVEVVVVVILILVSWISIAILKIFIIFGLLKLWNFFFRVPNGNIKKNSQSFFISLMTFFHLCLSCVFFLPDVENIQYFVVFQFVFPVLNNRFAEKNLQFLNFFSFFCCKITLEKKILGNFRFFCFSWKKTFKDSQFSHSFMHSYKNTQ